MERRPPTNRELQRLIDELSDTGIRWDGSQPWHDLAVTALEYARRPIRFESRIPSFGAVIAPTTPPSPAWSEGTALNVEHRPISGPWLKTAHLYADGLSSWIVLNPDGNHSSVVFDRPAGSERDLVVIAATTGATLVQRHPDGLVRIVDGSGVHRWDGMDWQHQPPLSSWIDAIVTVSCDDHDDRDVLERLVEFALHDLGARHIGATLVYRPAPSAAAGREARLPTPPPLRITRPPDLAPLRHALAQIDGATVFDDDGVLREIGVRLVPTTTAETEVPSLRGMRHTSARRYSADDPSATVIAVSESGGVTILRAGQVVGVAPGSPSPDD